MQLTIDLQNAKGIASITIPLRIQSRSTAQLTTCQGSNDSWWKIEFGTNLTAVIDVAPLLSF